MNNLTFSYQFKPIKRKKKKNSWLILLIPVLIFSGYLVVKNLLKHDLISPLSSIQAMPLEKAVEQHLIGTKGTYGVVVKNLKTGESYSRNEHRVFESGSLYKLWVLATAYQQIQENRFKKEVVLSEDIASLNKKFHIDPEFAEFSEGTITLRIQDALRQMITISHNYAALLVTEKVKLSSVATFLKTNKLNESTLGISGASPTVTPFDAALYLEKLYKGQFANEKHTKEMIDLLTEQKLNNGLPKYLPGQVKIAHKTGEIGWFKHDAGIVFTPKGDYIIVVMSESNSPTASQQKIALISKAVFDYFNSL